jgi:hypothetical protein
MPVKHFYDLESARADIIQHGPAIKRLKALAQVLRRFYRVFSRTGRLNVAEFQAYEVGYADYLHWAHELGLFRRVEMAHLPSAVCPFCMVNLHSGIIMRTHKAWFCSPETNSGGS